MINKEFTCRKHFWEKSEKKEENEKEEEEEDEIKNVKERINREEYFEHDFFKNDYIKQMKILKNNFIDFKGKVKKIVSFINDKYKNFKNSIIKEEDELCSDENNEKIQNFNKLLKDYKFENNDQSINKFIDLTQRSIMNNNIENEYIEFSNTELIIYRGEVSKGTRIRNGKGKEFYLNGELKYEGEYLNDKREGKGKEYSEEGELIFIGKYKEGEHWNGIKKIFEEFEDENEQVIKYVKYISQIKKGKMNGKCKEFDKEGNLIYEGEFSEGKRNGDGKEFFKNNVQFEGEFKEGNGKEMVMNIMRKEIYYLMVHIKMGKDIMEKLINISMTMKNFYMKQNIKMVFYGMRKDIIKMRFLIILISK